MWSFSALINLHLKQVPSLVTLHYVPCDWLVVGGKPIPLSVKPLPKLNAKAPSPPPIPPAPPVEPPGGGWKYSEK